MKLTDDQAVMVLRRVSRRTSRALAHGARLREEMAAQLARGEQPTGYRIEFIRNASLAVVEALLEVSAQFNRDHPDDCVSSNDLMDVLATTMKRLAK